MCILFRDTGQNENFFAPLPSECFVNLNMHCSRVTLLTGAQNHTVVLNVERDRVHEATFEGIDRENITIHACSDQDLLVLQATPLEVRVIQTLGASASGSSKLLESWTPSCILSSDARVAISHATTAGSNAVIVHHRDNQAELSVLKWGLTGIRSICGATVSQQQVRIPLVYRRMELIFTRDRYYARGFLPNLLRIVPFPQLLVDFCSHCLVSGTRRWDSIPCSNHMGSKVFHCCDALSVPRQWFL